MVCTAFALALSSIFSLTFAAPLRINAAPINPLTTRDSYIMFGGDGSMATGWPTRKQWMDFEDAWDANLPTIQTSCETLNWGPNNDATEIAAIKSSIIHESTQTSIPSELILAIIMQESKGCVRAPTTAWEHANPGLMQTAKGKGSCNVDGQPISPCPEETIARMVQEGTSASSGLTTTLESALHDAGTKDDSRWYRAARIYNAGRVVDENLGLGPTECYASDVANRLVSPFADSPCQPEVIKGLTATQGVVAVAERGVEGAVVKRDVRRPVYGEGRQIRIGGGWL